VKVFKRRLRDLINERDLDTKLQIPDYRIMEIITTGLKNLGADINKKEVQPETPAEKELFDEFDKENGFQIL
jgi:hypothetical protein